MKETKNSALTTAQAFYHQSIVALDKCFEMEKEDCIYIEKDGDISLITEGENTGSQIEVKDVAAALTDHHESFWKTLKNWLAPEFNHEQYNHLILHSTQLFGKTTKLAKWNDSSPQERLKILQDIYSSNSSTSEIARMQADVMNKGDDALLQVIGKITLFTEAVGNWLEFTKSLNEDLDNSPIYKEKTKSYQAQLISQYKAKYRTAQIRSEDPRILYNEITGNIPQAINNYTPHVAYRNGVMHDAMDSNDDLKWDTTK